MDFDDVTNSLTGRTIHLAGWNAGQLELLLTNGTIVLIAPEAIEVREPNTHVPEAWG